MAKNHSLIFWYPVPGLSRTVKSSQVLSSPDEVGCSTEVLTDEIRESGIGTFLGKWLLIGSHFSQNGNMAAQKTVRFGMSNQYGV